MSDMPPSRRTPSKFVFVGIVIALVGLLGVTFFQYSVLKLRVAFADGQTHVFSEMRDKALQSDILGAASCLQYVAGYYPSGTKQTSGSQLDRIVERERATVIRDIIALLRSKTHDDVGTNAEPWIQKYSKQ